MTENQKAWLKAMYDAELTNAKALWASKHVQAEHAVGVENYIRHKDEENEHHEYIDILASLRKQVDAPELNEEAGL